MDNIDWWGLIWESIGTLLPTWAKVIADNPWPWVAIFAIGLLGLLTPARRRRRRS